MEKIAFFVDTGSYYSNKKLDNVFVIPISIIVSDNNEVKYYNDSLDIDRNELEKFLESSKQVSTSQPNIIQVEEKIKESLLGYDKVIFIPLSRHLSGFYNTLLNLKKNNFKDKLILLDSESVGIDGYWIIEELLVLIKEQKIEITQESLNNYVNKRKAKICGSVIVANINQLIKGGRLKGWKATVAKTLKMKLTIKFQGDLQFYSKDLNLDIAISKTLKMIDSENHFMTRGIKNISIMNDLKNKEFGNELISKILKLLKLDSYTPSLLPGCIISHVGTDTFSILIEAN